MGDAPAKITWYVRDASGNVMAIYTRGDETLNSGHLTQAEVPLYSSSRLGLWRPDRDVEVEDWELFETSAMPGTAGLRVEKWTRGRVQFELSNHLGNVLVTISDKKIGVDANSDGIIDYYNADVITANDYYPFGSQMPGRKYSQANTTYRYGFNGQEKDNEDFGDGNAYDFGARIYDPRLGRFLSVDALTKGYPSQTPYCFAGNSPILFIDAEGNGPDLPPAYVTWALLTNHPIGTWALLSANNTSPNQLYKWITKTSSDPMAYLS